MNGIGAIGQGYVMPSHKLRWAMTAKNGDEFVFSEQVYALSNIGSNILSLDTTEYLGYCNSLAELKLSIMEIEAKVNDGLSMKSCELGLYDMCGVALETRTFDVTSLEVANVFLNDTVRFTWKIVYHNLVVKYRDLPKQELVSCTGSTT